MLITKPEDAIHKAWLLRLLTAIADNNKLNSQLYFKGGTCAALRGFLNRFSIDLDFDIKADPDDLPIIRKELEKIYVKLGLSIKDQSQNTVQYFLKYDNKENQRNTIKLDCLIPPPKNNKYEVVNLADIDRSLNCQTKETMFANKLVAALDRFQKTGKIAGRDIYDINIFFLNGFDYEKDIIKERTNKNSKEFIKDLIVFIEKQISQKILTQDLNFLLPYNEFNKIRKTLKAEVLMFLRNELGK